MYLRARDALCVVSKNCFRISFNIAQLPELAENMTG